MTVTWIYGQSKSGKTTLAKKIAKHDGAILLDGDTNRRTICTDLGFTHEDRTENNLRVARLARELDSQGFNVVVSTIAPYRELRNKIYKICGCRFIYVEGQHRITSEDYPFEAPI